MRPHMMMSVFGIFVIGTLLCCLASGRWLLNGELDIINALASFNTMEVQAGGVWNAPKTLSTYYDAAVTAFMWNYPFLESGSSPAVNQYDCGETSSIQIFSIEGGWAGIVSKYSRWFTLIVVTFKEKRPYWAYLLIPLVMWCFAQSNQIPWCSSR